MTNTKVFISCDEFSKNEFDTYIAAHPEHRIIIWAPENMYVPQLYRTPDEWKTFSKSIDDLGIDYVLVIGYSESNFYDNHPRVIGWDDFAAYDVLSAFVDGRTQISPSPKNMTKHYVTKFGRESERRTIMTDSLAKYGVLDNTNFHYYNNGNPFEFAGYQPKYWDKEISELIHNDSNYAIPPTQYWYLSSAMEIIVEKSMDYPHIYNYFFIPILFGKPSVVFAAKGYYDRVKSIFGIDMYEDVIDTTFDDFDDRLEAADFISRQLKTLSERKSADHLARDTSAAAINNLRLLVDHVKAKNVNSEIKLMVELPELSYYKDALNAGDKMTFMGKAIYPSS